MSLPGYPGYPGYDDALRKTLDRIESLSPETVAVDDAFGRVLRQEVIADRDQPPFHRSAMDGFAVRSCEIRAGSRYPIVADIPAGAVADPTIDLTQGIARIATGAALPDAYDATIQVELAHVEGDHVRFDLESCDLGRNIHSRGQDAKAGDLLLRVGQMIAGPQMGIAAATGHAYLEVTRQPRVTLLTTGDEVRPPDTPLDQLAPQQIRNSNASMLRGLLAKWGVPLYEHTHVPDEPEQTLAAAREALSHCNLVLTTGGISVGARDFLPDAWQQLGLDVVLHGVAMQPGKPVFVAQPKDEQEKLVIGLPGNPVSVLTSAILFVQPALRKYAGLVPDLDWQSRTLADEVKPNAKRQLFRAARLNDASEVEVIAWHGSGDLSHTADMQGIVRLPIQNEPLHAGDEVRYLSL